MRDIDRKRELWLKSNGQIQRNAEEILEKHNNQAWVEVYEAGTGKKKKYREEVAEVMIKKGKAEKPRTHVIITNNPLAK